MEVDGKPRSEKPKMFRPRWDLPQPRLSMKFVPFAKKINRGILALDAKHHIAVLSATEIIPFRQQVTLMVARQHYVPNDFTKVVSTQS